MYKAVIQRNYPKKCHGFYLKICLIYEDILAFTRVLFRLESFFGKHGFVQKQNQLFLIMILLKALAAVVNLLVDLALLSIVGDLLEDNLFALDLVLFVYTIY